MANITPSLQKIEIISPHGIVPHIKKWWESTLGKIGITTFTLGGLKTAIEMVEWLLDFRGRSQEAMTWVSELSRLLHHLPHISEWVNAVLLASGTAILIWDNRQRHRVLSTQQISDKSFITDQDPQVIVEIRNQEFADDLELHTPYNRPLIFDNRGKRDAMRVRVEMGKLNEGWAECEEMSIIKHGEKKLILPHIKDSRGKDIVPFQEFSLEMLLQAEWQFIMQSRRLAGAQREIVSSPTTISVPVKITYQDHNENKFRTEQTMIYYFYKDGVKGYIEFTAPKFMRL